MYKQNKIIIALTLIAMNLALNACIQQNSRDQAINTAEQLLYALVDCDSAKVAGLTQKRTVFDKNKEVISPTFHEDCKLLKAIFKMNAFPRKEKFEFINSEYGKSITSQLIDTPDTILNLKDYVLAVRFLPDQLLTSTYKL